MEIETDGNNLLLKIPKDLIARDYAEQFMDRIELEMLVKKRLHVRGRGMGTIRKDQRRLMEGE